MNNSKSIFLDNNFNYDIKQCKALQKNKLNLENSYNSNNNNNNLNTLIEAKEYIGCIGNKCSLISEEKINNNLTNKKLLNFQKDNNITNSISIINNSNIINSNIINSIVEFIYLVTIILLLINCFLNKSVYNLITILIITLVFIFYKIYINF